jgi:hypothetical protein
MNDGFRAADLSVSRHLAELRASGRVRRSCPNAPKRRSICHSARLHSGLPGANLNDCAQQRRSALRNGPAPPAFRGAGAKELPILRIPDRLGPNERALYEQLRTLRHSRSRASVH